MRFVTAISLGVVFVALNRPSHFFYCSWYTLTWSPVLISNFVVGGGFDFNSLSMSFSATTISISAFAVSIAANLSVSFPFCCLDMGRMGENQIPVVVAQVRQVPLCHWLLWCLYVRSFFIWWLMFRFKDIEESAGRSMLYFSLSDCIAEFYPAEL